LLTYCIIFLLGGIFLFSPVSVSAVCIDSDGDGFGSPGDISCPKGIKTDCDNTDPKVYPGAPRICDGKDSDCDGRMDFSTDIDNDADGVPWCAGDCNDNNPNIFPGNTEIYGTALCSDGLDNDCDNRTDLLDLDCQNPCTDKDGDGYGNPASTFCPNPQLDCHDFNAAINPGALDANCNGIDENCSGAADEGYVPTGTNCGVGACAATGQNICQSGVVINTCTPGVPQQEGPMGSPTCSDNIDNNCNSLTDANDPKCLTACVDNDGDGYGANGDPSCPKGSAVDCNDNNAGINPGASDANCNGIDENCNVIADDQYVPTGTTCGVGACAATGQNICQSGAVVNTCTAGAPQTEGPPGSPTCSDGIDNNCNGLTDGADNAACNPVNVDNDGDGYCEVGPCVGGAAPGDCDDTDSKVFPGAVRICDGKDNDCDGRLDFSTDVDNDKDGYPICVMTGQQYGDCNDNNPNVNPGMTEGPFGDPTCSDGLDNNCNTKADAVEPRCLAPTCGTKSSPKDGPHFFTLLNPDGTVNPNSGALDCGKCHNPANFQDNTRFQCQRCHADPSDTSDPLNGTLKAQYPLPPPYGYGSAPNVKLHSSTVVGTKYGNWNPGCSTCHNPHQQEQNLAYMTSYGQYIKEYVCFDNAATGQRVEELIRFTAPTGVGSFADGPPFNKNICEMCHTRTNHHRRTGNAPGDLNGSGNYIGHNDGTNCMGCHPHNEGFKPIGAAPPPHDAFDCTVCHVTPDTYVPNAAIPDSACFGCHGQGAPNKSGGGSDIKVDTHFSTRYTDPTTGSLMNIRCVECHNPMSVQTNFRGNANLKFVRSAIRGSNIAFESLTGLYSFANDSGKPADMQTQNYVCNTCHTQTNHHQNDGTAPGGQSHNDGTRCTACHPHNVGFHVSVSVPPPHDVFDCEVCHITPDTFVPNANIPNSACNFCHGTGTNGASVIKVETHYSIRYTDPMTGSLVDLRCVECHNPMSVQTNFRGNTNLKFIRTQVRGNNIAFESYSGQYSFASDSNKPADMQTQNYICNTCHTQANHHQNDGTAPGSQSHNDGIDCTICHMHAAGFQHNVTTPAPHNVFDCTVCHVTPDSYVANANIPNNACFSCHGAGAPGKTGGGSDLKVDRHFSDNYIDPTTGQLMDIKCVTCHNPMSIQTNFRGMTNLKFVRKRIRGNNIAFESYTGRYSFANDSNKPADMQTQNYICNTCHTQTNHHQNDGTAPGGQSHNDGVNCTVCHPHIAGFQPEIAVPPPHDVQSCESCHVTADTYVPNANIPNSACLNCHGVGNTGSSKKVDRHYSDNYIDPTTGILADIRCVECHNPMSTQSNLVFIRSTIRTKPVVFTAYSGANSFADGGAPYNGICEVCHTQTNHHQNDGTAPGGQNHNNGVDCRQCHQHIDGFIPVIDVPAPHNAQACETCHVTADTYVPNANIPNSACLGCHGVGNSGSSKKVQTHYSDNYIDPTTGILADIRCVECHNPMSIQTNFRGVMNLSFIRTMIRGNNVAFEAYTGQYSFASDNNKPAGMQTQNYICNTCHSQTNHHQADGTAPGGQSHNDGADCRTCHKHLDGFQPSGSCIDCHSVQQGNRVAVVNQFIGNSHHVQGVELTDDKCYQCHWEANSDGTINNTYHGGWNAPGSSVNLVVYGNGSRPTTYNAGTTAVVYTAGAVVPPMPATPIAVVNAWINLSTSGSGSSRTAIFAAGSGANRMVLIGLAWESSNSCNPSSITGNYGGQTITTITKAVSSDNRQGQWMGYIGQAGIAARTNNTISLTFNGCTPDRTPTISAATYQNVSQSIAPSSVTASGTSGSSFSWNGLPVVASGYAMYNVSADGISSFTQPSGYTERYDTSTSNFRMTGGDKAITVNGTESRTVTGNTSSPRWALVAAAISPAGSVSGSREVEKINQHCLGCHSAQNSNAQPFGDGKTPKQYAWDNLSIAERYSQTGTTPWGKYADTATTDITPKNTQTKAYSAHGNAASNQQGWNLNETWPNTSGTGNVVCFDCHNSHGSTVAGTTTSYKSFNNTPIGGILKDTTAGLGGYLMSYKPQLGGSIEDKNPYNPGAAICFDCHMTQSSGTTPWGYQGTFGATQAILGYWEKPYWFGAAGVNPAGPQMRYPYKNAIGSRGGHLSASMPLKTTPMKTIGGLCTPCHDPHGVSPTLGSNQQYGVPLLKGTWLTSPYKEDVAPFSVTDIHGTRDEDGRDPAYTQASMATYHIDQNTFGPTTTRSSSVGPVISWNFNNTTRVTETADQFAGLCLQCHSKAQIAPTTGTQTNPAPWRSMDRIHNSVKGWGTYGANANNAVHSYTCSKCHTPHNACLDRLLITDCLDSAHRGQVATGGFPGGASVRGDEGDGRGQFPGGGGGRGEKQSYAYFFGTTSGLRTCHDNTNSDPWPDNQLWNEVSAWGTLGSGSGSGGGGGTCSSISNKDTCEHTSGCEWNDGSCRNKN